MRTVTPCWKQTVMPFVFNIRQYSSYTPTWCWEELRFWCLPSFFSVLPSRFVVTQLFVSILNADTQHLLFYMEFINTLLTKKLHWPVLCSWDAQIGSGVDTLWHAGEWSQSEGCSHLPDATKDAHPRNSGLNPSHPRPEFTRGLP